MMSRFIILFSFVTFLLLLTPSTVALAPEAKPAVEAPNTEAALKAEDHEELKDVARGNAEFAKNLYGILSKKRGNIIFSPISIHAILSLLCQGAGGKTKETIMKILKISDATVAVEGYAELMNHFDVITERFNVETYDEEETVSFKMANRVFLRNIFSLKESFKAVATKFRSEVQLLDFSNSKVSAKTVNDWVMNNTNNIIKDVVKPHDFDDKTRLVLVNAVYFKNNWQTQFNEDDTKTERFYTSKVDAIDVEMMHQKTVLKYKTDNKLNAQVLQMNFFDDDSFRLIVILPEKRNGIEELEAKLANVDLTNIRENMQPYLVTLSLPKFIIEQNIDLAQPLFELGLGDLFNPKVADFSGMVQPEQLPGKLYVSKVIHKVILEVNEEGTEAAAASNPEELLYSSIGSKKRLPHVTVVADHPFIILLAKEEEGSVLILFKGRISVPKYQHEHDRPRKKHYTLEDWQYDDDEYNNYCPGYDVPSLQLIIFLFATFSYFISYLVHHAFC